MQLLVQPDGTVRCVYGQEIHLASLGTLNIMRGSHVEPTDDGSWTANLSPCSGPLLGPFCFRSEALAAEREWLSLNWLLSEPACSLLTR